MMRDTLFVTAGRNSARDNGAVNVPVYRASTVLSPDWAAWQQKKARQAEGAADFYYGRSGTPTTEALLAAVTAAEGGTLACAYPSGLAACAGAVLAVAGAGDHILVTDTVYGPVRRLCAGLFARLGIETTFFDPRTTEDLRALFRSNTRAIYLESPGSQSMELMDVPHLAAIARDHGAFSILDNTWAALRFFAPFRHGVDISVHAATKYIVGHSDAVLGLAIASDRAAAALHRTALDLGQTISSDDAFLALRGLRTLPVRLRQHQETGLALAAWLEQRPEVRAVFHPGLPSSPDHALWLRDFTGASGLFSFELHPQFWPHVGALVDAMPHFGIGASWGGFESLILPGTTRRTAPGAVERSLVRLHAGLEDKDDLLADLGAGFAALNAAIS